MKIQYSGLFNQDDYILQVALILLSHSKHETEKSYLTEDLSRQSKWVSIYGKNTPFETQGVGHISSLKYMMITFQCDNCRLTVTIALKKNYMLTNKHWLLLLTGGKRLPVSLPNKL